MVADDLEASRRAQNLTNLRLQNDVVLNMDKILKLYDNNWSADQMRQVATALDEGNRLLDALEEETTHDKEILFTLDELMQSCSLELARHDLVNPDDKPVLTDILAVKKAIQERRANHNKGRVVSFTEMLESAVNIIEKIEGALRNSQLDATQLATIPLQTLDFVERAMNVTSITLALRPTDERIEELHAQDRDVDARIHDAQTSGDVVLAEECARQQIDVQANRLELVRSKFEKVAAVEAQNEVFRPIFEVQRTAAATSQTVRDAARSLRLRCDADLKAIEDLARRAELENTEAITRHNARKEASDNMLRDNVDQQAEGWKRLRQLEAEMQQLAQNRQAELQRRVQDVTAERRRTVKYRQVLDVVTEHRHLLELTAHNCKVMADCTADMDLLVMEACTAIKNRHDSLRHDLGEITLAIHREYLENFRVYYKSVGHMKYRKERQREDVASALAQANIHLQFCVETFDPAAKKHSVAKTSLTADYNALTEEIASLEARAQDALRAFAPTEKALVDARESFVDPVAETTADILKWRTEMVQYRTQLTQHEELQVVAERDQISVAREELNKHIAAGGSTAAAITKKGTLGGSADSNGVVASPAATGVAARTQ